MRKLVETLAKNSKVSSCDAVTRHVSHITVVKPSGFSDLNELFMITTALLGMYDYETASKTPHIGEYSDCTEL